MTSMRVTVRVEIGLPDGSTSVVERSVVPTGFGDNPIFFASAAEQASLFARMQVVDALNTVHGVAPHPATVHIS